MFKTIEECKLELVAHTEIPSKIVETHDDHVVLELSVSTDYLPVAAARASFGKEDKTGLDEKADKKLLKFLADHRHVSCFEHNYATFLIECPLFVRSQIMRHTSFKFNEVSRRYTSENIEFWIPDKWRKQSKNNKQASTDKEVNATLVVFTKDNNGCDINTYEEVCLIALDTYNALMKLGVCREQARAVLPQSLITRFYMTGNLRSWWSFLTSRLKDDTQYETRVVAKAIENTLYDLWPESMKALMGDNNDMV